MDKLKLKNALLSIAPEYFKVPSVEKKYKILERTFAYELYHQLRLQYLGSENYVHGELSKGSRFFPSRAEKNLYPDLIIHKIDGYPFQNKLAIEIKTGPNLSSTELIRDLGKLKSFTRQGRTNLRYEIGIMLIVNLNYEEYLASRRKKTKIEIAKLMRNDRIEIWNMNELIVETDYPFKLHENSLKTYST